MIKLKPISTPLHFEQAGQAANWQKEFLTHGGLNIETGDFVKFKNMSAGGEFEFVEYVLDSIAGATEFGSVALFEYADFEALFSKPSEIPAFLEALSGYGEDFWLNERHFRAFFDLIIRDEMECNTHQAIASTLAQQAYEHASLSE